MKTLKIFDFDGTLFDTLDDVIGKEHYSEVKGVEYPYKGWWSKPESLDLELDIKPIDIVFADYLNYVSIDPKDIYLITGRLERLRNQVEGVLNKFSINGFERVILNHTGLETGLFKIEEFEKLLSENQYDEIHIYEDREKHIEMFIEFFKSKKIPFVFNRISNVDGKFISESTRYEVQE